MKSIFNYPLSNPSVKCWDKSILEHGQYHRSNIQSQFITLIKVTLLFCMSILAMLSSTVELKVIELALCLALACTIGYEFGSRKIKAVLPVEHHRQEIAVPVVDSKELVNGKSEKAVEIVESHRSRHESQKEKAAQVALPPQDIYPLLEKSQSDRFSNELLKEKVELDHKKIQSTSYFETRLESSKNTKFMRKIQKHQIVTDYELETETSTNMVIPFKNNPISTLSEPQSLLEVVAHQDYNIKLPSPFMQQKFISLGQLNSEWKQQMIPTWILQNGRFSKTYSQSKLIGQGGFGRVYEAINLLQDKKYAIKKLVMKGMVKVHELMNEVSIISKFNHPHIVSYFSCWIELATIDDAELVSVSFPMAQGFGSQRSMNQEQEMIYIESNSGFTFERSSKKSKTKSISKSKLKKASSSVVPYEPFSSSNINLIQICTLHIQMELCETSLHNYMKKRNEVDSAQAFDIFEQIVSGINFLHSNGIVHRDLKPANILLCKHKGQVKIGDFGLAALVEEHNQLIIREKVGTPLYMAPEIQHGNKIQRKKLDLIDVYAVGVIYYELLHLLNLSTHHQRSEKLLSLQSNKVIFVDKELKEERKMIKLLTKINNRPNIKEVLGSKQMQDLRKKYKIKPE